jgi:hypothetical protein
VPHRPGTAAPRHVPAERVGPEQDSREGSASGIASPTAFGSCGEWTFAGSDAGGRRAAALYTLIETAKLNHIDPRAWLGDVLARLPGHPARRLAELLPWNSRGQIPAQRAA